MAEILIIDDDPQMRRLLARLLKGDGHTVHEASNGRDGIELFRQVHPVLVITDLVMPEQEGIETIRELRDEAPTIPILAISGGGPPVYLRAATGLGASAALKKPFGLMSCSRLSQSCSHDLRHPCRPDGKYPIKEQCVNFLGSSRNDLSV